MLLQKRSWIIFLHLICILFIIVGLLGLFFLYSPYTVHWRNLVADTLITTQHREWAKYIIGTEGLNTRVAEYQEKFEKMGEEEDIRVFGPAFEAQSIEPVVREVKIEKIERKRFSGYLLYVTDPKQVKLGVPNRVGRGEQVSSMVQRTGAIAGVNAGGFVAPNQKGNGFVPIGLVISGGQLFFNNGNTQNPQNIVGIDKYGKMVAGKFTLSEIKKMEIQEAVSFSPRFIVNGKGLIKSQSEGYGIAPRTAMAQLKDGTIVFVVIDGRQSHSVGASLYDIQEILLEKGAVIAANLDGGASTVLVHEGKVLNAPSANVERYIPTAWLVFNQPEKVIIPNIWQGLDNKKIDPLTW